MKTTLCLVFIISYLDFVICDGHKALILKLKRNPTLISIPDNVSLRVKCDNWVTACPAETADEQKFNEKYSLYNGALFVKNLYGEKDYCTTRQKDICKEPYKLSMAWFKETIELGYEIYFEHDESLDSKFDINDAAIYDDYEPLKAFLEVESLSFMDKLKFIHALRKSEAEAAETQLMLGDKKMEFIWIPLFKLWFYANRLRKIEYQIRKDNVIPMLYCEDYNLGKELIHNVDVDKLYSTEHQKERLKGLRVPPESAENGCEEGYKCLTKWSLIPSDQFQFETNPDSTPKCSNIVTVPIWKSTVEEILDKLDVYLYTLSRISGQPLRIVAGVSNETLSLPRSGYFVLSPYVKLVDAKTKFTIRAPNIIYKIVKFKTDKCQIENDICWYGVLIVVHNNPYYDGKRKICKDVTEDWGWWEIKFKNYDVNIQETPSKFIYACKITRESIEAVGLTYRHDMIIYDLRLSHFLPKYEKGSVSFTEMDIKVNEELDRMFQGGDIEISEEVIERPPIYDEDFGIEINPKVVALKEGEDKKIEAASDANPDIIASEEGGDGKAETPKTRRKKRINEDGTVIKYEKLQIQHKNRDNFILNYFSKIT